MLRSAIAEMRQHVALEVAAARYLHLDAVLGAQGRHGDRHATGVAELEEDWHGSACNTILALAALYCFNWSAQRVAAQLLDRPPRKIGKSYFLCAHSRPRGIGVVDRTERRTLHPSRAGVPSSAAAYRPNDPAHDYCRLVAPVVPRVPSAVP